MNRNDYAYAIARVRVRELSLLTQADMRQLVSAADASAVLRLLSDKGWKVPAGEGDYSAMFEAQSADAREFLAEAAPDISELDPMIVENDFHNLKAAFKAVFSNENPEDYYITPSILPLKTIGDAVKNNDYSALPEYMRLPAAEAYDAIVRLKSGRMADLVLDRAALAARLAMAREGIGGLMAEIAQLDCECVNVKIALRAAQTGKTREQIAEMLCPGLSPSPKELADAALSGLEAVRRCLAGTLVADASQELEHGLAAFERCCDNEKLKLLRVGKSTPVGPEPLIAYYYAKEIEIKNVRIILSAKHNGLSTDEIKLRVRDVYA